MRSSFFQFKCSDWSVVNGSYFDIPTSNYYYNMIESSSPCSEMTESIPEVFPDNSNYTDGIYYCLQNTTTSLTTDWQGSSSNTSRVRFGFQDPTNPGSTTVNSIAFASLIKGPGSTKKVGFSTWPLSGSDSTHSLLSCTFDQVFIEFGVACSRTISSLTGSADCSYDSDFRPVYRVQDTAGDSGAKLGLSLPEAFIQYTSPNDGGQYSTTFSEFSLLTFQLELARAGNQAVQKLVNIANLIEKSRRDFLGLYNQEDSLNADGFNLSSLVSPIIFENRMSYLFNTFVGLGNMFELGSSKTFVTDINTTTVASDLDNNFKTLHDAWWYRTGPTVFIVNITWAATFLVCVILLLVAGVISVVVESLTVAPDTLGYVSSVARNSKDLRLPKSKVNSAMSGGERANKLGRTVVMMQDVGRIALGLKHEKAKKLETGRLYR